MMFPGMPYVPSHQKVDVFLNVTRLALRTEHFGDYVRVRHFSSGSFQITIEIPLSVAPTLIAVAILFAARIPKWSLGLLNDYAEFKRKQAEERQLNADAAEKELATLRADIELKK